MLLLFVLLSVASSFAKPPSDLQWVEFKKRLFCAKQDHWCIYQCIVSDNIWLCWNYGKLDGKILRIRMTILQSLPPICNELSSSGRFLDNHEHCSVFSDNGWLCYWGYDNDVNGVNEDEDDNFLGMARAMFPCWRRIFGSKSGKKRWRWWRSIIGRRRWNTTTTTAMYESFLLCFMITKEGEHTYTLGENEFSDWTLQEFLDTMTGYK